MSHHPSCKPGDRALLYKCTQCGTEEEATHLEDLRAELLRTQEQLVRTIDSKPALIARINALETQAAKDLKGGALQALLYLAEVERADQAEAKLANLQHRYEFELGYDMGLELKVEELKAALTTAWASRDAMSEEATRQRKEKKLTQEKLEQMMRERDDLQLKMDLGG